MVFADGQAAQDFDTNNVTFAITSHSLSLNWIEGHVSIHEKSRARQAVKVVQINPFSPLADRYNCYQTKILVDSTSWHKTLHDLSTRSFQHEN